MYSIGSITIDLNMAATIALGILSAFVIIQVYIFFRSPKSAIAVTEFTMQTSLDGKGDVQMTEEKKGYQKAAILSTFSIVAGTGLTFQTFVFAGQVGGPILLIMGLFVGYRFWWKGKYGNEEERRWVDNNF